MTEANAQHWLLRELARVFEPLIAVSQDPGEIFTLGFISGGQVA